MAEVLEIKDGDMVLARHVPAEAAWKGGLSFFSADEEFIQFGTWGYDSGKHLLAHTHNEVPREARWTQEVIYVRRGRIRAHVYGLQEQLLTSVDVNEGDIIVLLRGGHGYDILEDGTQVLEVKNGPYVGAERDRRRF
ncbi:MAG: hypothetical protein ACYC1S_13685 [Gemmatimonadaceae bacterium]